MNDSATHPEVTAIFEREWTRLVAVLVRDLRDLGAAEDAAQEAFIEASRRWPTDGVPDRPAAWLLTTARRRAIDGIRRTKRLDELLPLVGRPDATDGSTGELDAALDDQLALLVGCCHPALAHEAQIALTLRIVAGLSTAQIANAFLTSEATMTRRITRAKDKVRLAGIPFEPPTLDTLAQRLPAVCAVIHSIFTEGHTSATSAELVRGDLCDEAIWLGELLHRLVPSDPEVDGLLSLMLLIDARREARVDADGRPVLLRDQDRARWDRNRIDRGLAALARAHAAQRGGPFQFHAAIAGHHATAPTFDDTDWRGIVRLYDVLMRRQPTALLALNRSIAVAEADGPDVGLFALDAILLADDLDGDLSDYHYFHAARGELLTRLGRDDEAVEAIERAIACCDNDAQRLDLERRRRRLAHPDRPRHPVSDTR
ncbi:RNA polymerase sigma factor [Ilumatobacter coccineus]|uniref:Putative RNA polymerase ECF subfamily sigma factor n=1 Tax=Ilumatobacter coccineus (strain NBRC 103263 / KCTC 29153 / YM16-304) TaxID=1313172 RepID=A0A6C7E134_ILUCY|nr:DUF6596 domain-containing protein [Ilumatobacter coccineus]BAN00643.1 putative RNA polymerase ECF subfamily sigma factor [Ilumatobacter coccineus YM16-304]